MEISRQLRKWCTKICMTDKQIDNRLQIRMSEPYQRMKADFTRHLLAWPIQRIYADHATIKYSNKDMQLELNRGEVLSIWTKILQQLKIRTEK